MRVHPGRSGVRETEQAARFFDTRRTNKDNGAAIYWGTVKLYAALIFRYFVCIARLRVHLPSTHTINSGDDKNTQTISRLSGRACSYEQPRCLVFSYSLRFQRGTSIFSRPVQGSIRRSKSLSRSVTLSRSSPFADNGEVVVRYTLSTVKAEGKLWQRVCTS